jgi:Cys-tRNA(Pro) deacylase
MDNLERVKNFLENKNYSFDIKEFLEVTRTSSEAAEAIGCRVEQIAKSIVFKTEDEEPILVILSGKDRVNIKKVERVINKKIKKADANFVKEKTGFPIGGVAPIAHSEKIRILIDKNLKNQKEIWTSAGTLNSVFKLTPKELEELTGGKILNLKE